MLIEKSDISLAHEMAKCAGDLLIEFRKNSRVFGAELGRQADERANSAILEILAQNRPNDGLLSEEIIDDFVRLNKSRVWIIDPLDGTREYEQGRDDWAVHIGLAINGKAALGVVAIPMRNLAFASKSGSELSQQDLNKERKSARPIIAISRSRPPDSANELAQFLGADLQQIGSAGVKAMAVIEGRADIYFHIGGQSLWDNCAPIAVAKSYGLYAGDIFGNEINYSRRDIFVPNLLICRQEHKGKITDWAKLKFMKVG